MRKEWLIVTAIAMMTAFSAQASEPEPVILGAGNLRFGDLAPNAELNKVDVISEDEEAEMDRAMRAYTPSEDSLLQNKANTFYYYEQLDDETQAIYDAMLMVADDPVSEDNYALHLTTTDPTSDEFFMKVYLAYTAMTYDHPELFWLYQASEATISFGSTGMQIAGMYPVYFGMADPYADYEAKMTAFNQAAEAFLSDIDTSGTEYDTVRQIHDKLIRLVTYDDHVFENAQQEAGNLAHTAYGALVQDSQGIANYAVCDGYSLAMEYLCGQCGIDAVFVGGMAGYDETDMGGHAWNLIKMDGVWYEVDSTWDDSFDTLEESLPREAYGYDYIVEALHDPEYYEKLEHYLFGVSTEEIRNYTASGELYYLSNDFCMLFTLAFDSVHIRSTEEMSLIDGAIFGTAPVATETLHR